jgi:hypothetical protein
MPDSVNPFSGTVPKRRTFSVSESVAVLIRRPQAICVLEG